MSLRHNSLRDSIANTLKDSGCTDVMIEPPLLNTAGAILRSGSNISDGARLDVSARSVWNPLERASLDIRVFHAQAQSNRDHKTIARMYQHHENLKKIAYNDRVLQIEKGVFTPVVFSTAGGMGKEAQSLIQRIAERCARKCGQRYSDTISHIRRRLRFDLLRTTIIALRGHRGKPTVVAPTIAELDVNLIPDV